MSAPIFSADAHIIEPADLWQERLPPSLADRAPHYIYEAGMTHWSIEGVQFVSHPSFRRPNGELLDHSPDKRRDDMEQDGITAEVIHPNLGLVLYSLPDLDFAMACARVYNDYLVESYLPREEFCAVPIVPVGDVTAAAEEMRRVLDLGLRGFGLPMVPPEGRPYHDPVYEPLWEIASEAGMPVSFHVGTGVWAGDHEEVGAAVGAMNLTGTQVHKAVERTMRAPSRCLESTGPVPLLASLVAGSVLERHPDLHVVCVESDAGWLAHAMTAMDLAWREPGIGQMPIDDLVLHRSGGSDDEKTEATPLLGHQAWHLPRRPSDYIRSQVHVTFMDDPAGLLFRDVTGVESLMWGSDYPHYEGTWPMSRENVAAAFAEVPIEDAAAILGGNTRRLYFGAPSGVESVDVTDGRVKTGVPG